MPIRDFSHIAGCLLGGAVGDALGAPVEFLSLAELRGQFGPAGVTDYLERNAEGRAEFTDDTQMTLFTAEGLLIARQRAAWDPMQSIYRAYLRWLRTQRSRPTGPTGELTREGRLIGVNGMWKIRAPGGTCLTALGSGRMGTPDQRINNSKGCGGVMRAAPVGMFFAGEAAFERGCQSAAITHGHPSGYLAAGVLAQTVAEIIARHEPGCHPREVLEKSILASVETLRRWPDHEETLRSVEQALQVAREAPAVPETVQSLGGAWVGEEALGISLFCALAHAEDFRAGVLLSVNHSGDSDSTGAITGNLLGLLNGVEAIPAPWLEHLDLREEIESVAQEIIGT